MAASNSGIGVPDNVIRCGGNTIVKKLVAEGAITPGDAVKFGSSKAQVLVCAAGDKVCIGVADLNYRAVQDGQNPMTHDFAAGEEVEVIMNGLVRVIADNAGFTMGHLVMIGSTEGYEIDDYLDTAVGGAFNQANLEAVKDELGMVIGRALTTAATTVAGVIRLF